MATREISAAEFRARFAAGRSPSAGFVPRQVPAVTGRGERPKKYGNKRTEYGGRWYASALEAKIAHELDLLKKLGKLEDWRPQVRLALEIPAPVGVEGDPITAATYVADFVIYAEGVPVEVIEAKGFWTDAAKLKRRVFEATWLRARPGVRFTVRTK